MSRLVNFIEVFILQSDFHFRDDRLRELRSEPPAIIISSSTASEEKSKYYFQFFFRTTPDGMSEMFRIFPHLRSDILKRNFPRVFPDRWENLGTSRSESIINLFSITEFYFFM